MQLFKKGVWTKSNPADSVLINYCPGLNFKEDGNNAAILWQTCLNTNGIAQKTDYLSYVCERSP